MSMPEIPPGDGAPPHSGGLKTLTRNPVRKPVAHPACPKCQRPMTVKQVMPVLFASDLDDVTYGCQDCETEAKRTVKRA